MPKKLIHVKQEHIDQARTGTGYIISHCAGCPVALALRDVVGTDYAHWPRVYDRTVRFGPQYNMTSDLSRRVSKFIRDFDAGDPVEPFKFYVDVPE